MRKIVHKNFFVWQADLEEKWLNEMSAQGWQLLSVALFRYEFEQGDKGEYCYRLELLEDWPTHPNSMEYIRFVEETGAEFIGRVKRWVYFRKRTADGAFELFSDIKSQLTVNMRSVQLLTVLFFVELAYLLPASYMLYTAPHLLLAGVIALNAVLELLMSIGLVKMLAKRSQLKRELAIRE